MSKRNVVHIEIPSADLEKSGNFYRDLFGWKITMIPEMNYATWDAGEGPGGGFSPLGGDTKAGEILIHVASEDIEADLRRAAELGGSILRHRTEIPGIGWWGEFRDPFGNQIALYTPKNP